MEVPLCMDIMNDGFWERIGISLNGSTAKISFVIADLNGIITI